MSQALSLKCNVCGVQLRSVQECQSHGEATGHADFVESTEAVLNLTCVACGKPCRSETEKDIHTKRTGHAEFVDKTNETAAAIDSEKEMKKLDADIKAELGVEGSSPMDVDSNPVDDPDEEKIEPEVDAKCLAELEGMGFNRNRAVRALYHTGTDNVEQAVNWIVEHENDADVDDPLLIAKTKIKKKLTKEEARIKAEELRKSMAAKKEKEEREMERLREQERIRSGKELLAAKRQEEELQLKRNLEARRIEKEEIARAKARIREKLEEDRIARRLKLGLPAELTEEEKQRERSGRRRRRQPRRRRRGKRRRRASSSNPWRRLTPSGRFWWTSRRPTANPTPTASPPATRPCCSTSATWSRRRTRRSFERSGWTTPRTKRESRASAAELSSRSAGS